jgi:hypothetical protein
MSMSSPETQDLRLAKGFLENPGFAAKISHIVGTPIEKGFALLPKKWKPVLVEATRKSIEAALDVALRTINTNSTREPSDWWHKVAVGTSGAAGGAFGFAALAIELPVSTTIMLRSIADIARSEGEDIRAPDSKVECIQVLALGGQSAMDDAAETGYFAARAAMAKAVSDAIRHIAEKGVVEKGAPAIVRLITAVASRFSVHVSEKVAAQAIPILGAVGGAVINTMFIDHFQRMARGHFIVRRLERIHGVEEVRRAYDEL